MAPQPMSDLTFVLLPGAGGDPWYWHRVVPELQAGGHLVIPVALPAADDDAGLPDYADAVIQAMGPQAQRRVVLVAQSMAGFTAPLVCERVPIHTLVLVNAMIPRPGESPGEWFGNTRQDEAKREQNTRDGRERDAPFDVLQDFFHDVPQPVIDAAWARGEPRQSQRLFGSRCTFKGWPAASTHVLVGREDRFFPAPFQQRIAQERLGAAIQLMPGGHLLALSQPQELARRLLACAGAA